jgi:two-component system, OmpR family, response regulator RegX3
VTDTEQYVTRDELAARLAELELRLVERMHQLEIRSTSAVVADEPKPNGSIVCDRRAMRVWADDQEIALTRVEMRLLLLLLDHEGELVTHEALLEALAQDHPWLPGDSRTAAVHLGRLRQKIERDPSNPQRIVTVRGFGYRFENTPR